MIEQAADFRAESDALYLLLQPLADADYAEPTQFKGWTLNNVLGHLHLWNHAADLSLQDGNRFQAFLADFLGKSRSLGLGAAEADWRGGIGGRALLEAWHDFYLAMSERFEAADPKQRLKWAGPDMSARSSITARLMETWAHGQEVYDHLGVERINGDRIRNIAVLGINTFGWTYANRGLAVPEHMPCVTLLAPSGATWQWGDPAATDDRIEGSATEFCQVVTQVRNIADTRLQVRGAVATQWMAFAQCFAGGPENPPAPGTRFTRRR